MKIKLTHKDNKHDLEHLETEISQNGDLLLRFHERLWYRDYKLTSDERKQLIKALTKESKTE